MNRISVLGAGAMGAGIGQVAAMAGHEVLLYDSFPGSLIGARDTILKSLNKLAEKGKITDQESKSIFGRIYFIDQPESIRDSDLVIEAIVENEVEKNKIFALAESLVREKTILASNTSSLSITALAAELKYPGRLIGMHFFNPPVLMKLVEIIPALQTETLVTEKVKSLLMSWGKIGVVAKDTPGFIVNRIARPFYGESLRIVEEQLATPAEIDQAMKDLGGFRMGPFELMDFIGNDVNLAVTRSVWTALHFETRYKPSPLQINLVRAGWLGKKSGKGFFDYSAPAHQGGKLTAEHTLIFKRILSMLINEAADALYFGVASRDDIDLAMTLGVNYPKGLLKWADETGIGECVREMDALHRTYREERYRCSVLLRKMADHNQNFYE